MLHIISASPYQSSALSDALAIASSEDDIILIDDASYAISHDLLTNSAVNNVFALQCALQTRGLNLSEANAHIQEITMASFVELSFSHEQSVSWY